MALARFTTLRRRPKMSLSDVVRVSLPLSSRKRLCKVLLLVAHADDEILFAGAGWFQSKGRFEGLHLRE